MNYELLIQMYNLVLQMMVVTIAFFVLIKYREKDRYKKMKKQLIILLDGILRII